MEVVGLRELGEAAWTSRDLFPFLLGRPDRAALAVEAERLRGDGMLNREIGELLGISTSWASTLCCDPTGDRERLRKASYGGLCEVCDALTCGSNGSAKAPKLCATCASTKLHEQRFWTPDRIVEQLRLAAAILGRTPSVADFSTSPSVRRRMSVARMAEADVLQAAIAAGRVLRVHPGDAQREFGSWAEAIARAGLSPCPIGGAGHRSPLTSPPPLATPEFAALVERELADARLRALDVLRLGAS